MPPAEAKKTADVLVVDDDRDAVEELVEFLAKAGLKCLSATDGWAALTLLNEGHRPNVVVSDLRMPELSGIEFGQQLMRLGEDERPELIFVSGNAGFDDAVEALRMGARDMLTKPIDGAALVQAVKQALLARKRRHQLGQSLPPVAEARKTTAEKGPTERKRSALNDLRDIRKVRNKFFPTELFSDPCWEMLLDLYDAQLSSDEVTVTSLGVASGVPATTALRRMETLQGHGLIERVADSGDKRRTIIRLTEAGLRAVEQFFESLLARRP
jgi:DNA-binding response OmpR family regulator/DNA-binding MarR family transcriptional regulator